MIKIGDKVVCVKSHSAGFVKKGNFYTVIEIVVCGRCGSVMYILDHYDVNPVSPYTYCCDYENDFFKRGSMASFLFRPLNYQKLTYAEIARAEVKEGTDVPAEVGEKELCN